LYLRNEKYTVSTSGTIIQANRRITAGEIINLAAVREALVAMCFSRGIRGIELKKRPQSVPLCKATPFKLGTRPKKRADPVGPTRHGVDYLM
jgi:hypothetical protein